MVSSQVGLFLVVINFLIASIKLLHMKFDVFHFTLQSGFLKLTKNLLEHKYWTQIW